jgi:hypothetical protein
MVDDGGSDGMLGRRQQPNLVAYLVAKNRSGTQSSKHDDRAHPLRRRQVIRTIRLKGAAYAGAKGGYGVLSRADAFHQLEHVKAVLRTGRDGLPQRDERQALFSPGATFLHLKAELVENGPWSAEPHRSLP